MRERDAAVKADIIILRSLATLDATILEATMNKVGMSLDLLHKREEATIRLGLYKEIVALATRLEDSWEEALMLTRATASQGSGDPDKQKAYARLIEDTNHLFGM